MSSDALPPVPESVFFADLANYFRYEWAKDPEKLHMLLWSISKLTDKDLFILQDNLDKKPIWFINLRLKMAFAYYDHDGESLNWTVNYLKSCVEKDMAETRPQSPSVHLVRAERHAQAQAQAPVQDKTLEVLNQVVQQLAV